MGEHNSLPPWIMTEDGTEIPIPISEINELPFVPDDEDFTPMAFDELTIDLDSGVKKGIVRRIGWSLLKTALRMVVLGR